MILDRLLAIMAPFSCAACGREGKLVCRGCANLIVVAKGSSCFLCNKLTPGWKVCASCNPKTKIRGVMVASHYGGHVKTLITMLKYERVTEAAQHLSTLLAAAVILPTQFDLVTAIPAATRRYRQRGYNQAQLIGRQLARQLRLPFAPSLCRLGNSRQVGTNRHLRFSQAADTMYVPRTLQVSGLKVLVVDDVVTTGATMNEAARALKVAGARYVWGAAAAKH